MIKDTEVLDIVMHNLLEYIRNYSRTSGSLWNYYRYTIDDGDVNVIVSHGKSFKYKTKIVGERPERPWQSGNPEHADQPPKLLVPSLDVEFTIPIKYLNSFWRSLNLPFIKM